MKQLAFALILTAACNHDPKGPAPVRANAPAETPPPARDQNPEPREEPNPGSQEPGARCFDLNLDDYEPCCSLGGSHCVPEDLVPERFSRLASPCEGGLCVPDRILTAQGVVEPVTCQSVGGAPGACMSACLPEVADVVDLLPQDLCEFNQRCVPCISPLDGLDTGACEAILCEPEQSGGNPEPEPEPEPEEEYSCENPPTEPTVDVSLFPVCGPGARCVPQVLVDDDLQDELATCENGEGFCIPDPLVAYQGIWTPPTCQFPGGLEGRCLSIVLPSVAERADELPQGSCAENERCSPCCDPFTGESTPSCSVGCDEGPAEGTQCEAIFVPCCQDEGQCLAEELIPEENRDSFNSDGCNQGLLCVPDIVREEDPRPSACNGEIPLLGGYSGVCLPKCMDIPLDFLIWSGSCPSHEDCVPCRDPLSGDPTGAPGCPG